MANQNNVEPMQIDLSNIDDPAADNHIIEYHTMDLEAYANNYKGLGRILRLIYIADHCLSLRREALTMAIEAVKKTYNVSLYVELYGKLAETYQFEVARRDVNLPDVADNLTAPMWDADWIESCKKMAANKFEKLDTDLKSFKTNSIKESIRRGHDDLGDHYLDCGDLSQALKSYARSRDYCTTPKHIVNLSLTAILINLYMRNFAHAMTYIHKIETLPEFPITSPTSTQFSKEVVLSVMARLRCSQGIADICMEQYETAAKYFCEISFDHLDYSEIVSPSDIAIYGGLCALATFDRTKLQKNVFQNSSFKLFLEIHPTIREILTKFYNAHYSDSLTMLESIKNTLLMDIYLARHVDKLFHLIRRRALIQYFSPYLMVDLKKMASALNTTLDILESELTALILDGSIKGRIDSFRKILVRKEMNRRAESFQKTMNVNQNFRRQCQLTVLRCIINTNKMVVMGEAETDNQVSTSASTSAA